MNKIFKKAAGKSCPYTVGKAEQDRISDIKKRLQFIINNKDADIHERQLVQNIFKLDEYDQNILLGYYELSNGNAARLAKYFGVRPNIITVHVNKILQQLQDTLKH